MHDDDKYHYDDFMKEEMVDFEDEFGKPTSTEPVPSQVMEKYQDKLPKSLLAYWQKEGFCGYLNGLFWTVNPEDYTDILADILKDSESDNTEENFVLARNAFGDLYIWNQYGGGALVYHPNTARLFDSRKVDIAENRSKEELEREGALFLSCKTTEREDEKGEDDKPYFDRALAKLGPLTQDEMYGFVPAWCLGGDDKLENLQKVDITTHLAFLLELEPVFVSVYEVYLNDDDED